MHCLWRDQEIIPELNWNNLLKPDLPRSLCSICEERLEILAGKQCSKCGRLSEQVVCTDCGKWEEDPKWRHSLEFNQSVLSYNTTLQEMITKWKYRGDYALQEVFRDTFKNKFKQTFNKLGKESALVPIPLSKERLYERGFNQAESLAKLLELPYQHALSRVHGEKQSKKSRWERLASSNPFVLESEISKPVILIDDIYTTGVTLRHAARLLKDSGCPKVYSFTLARG